MTSLESRGYFKQQLLKDSAPDHKLYKGLSLNKKLPVLIEEHHFPNSHSVTMFHEEISVFRGLDHPGCIPIIDSFYTSESPFVAWLVLEELSETLSPDFKEWTEPELREFLETVLEMLSDAQLRKVYFRDIAIDNFRLDAENAFRHSDFSAYYLLGEHKEYASPAVARYLADDEDDFGSALPFHNPYKSEVYSLGVVLLELAYGREMTDCSAAGLDLVRDMSVSEGFKDVISRMVSSNEESRLDPTELLFFLKGQYDLSDPSILVSRSKQHHEGMIHIESRIEGSVSQEGAISHVIYLTCVCCFQQVRISTTSAAEELQRLIPLECMGKHHIFCGLDCMIKYAYIETRGNFQALDTLKCPICVDYHLSPAIIADIKANWQMKLAPESSLRAATKIDLGDQIDSKLFRQSSPVLMPLDQANADITVRKCVRCQVSTYQNYLPVHSGDTHFFCSADCLRFYASFIPEVPDLKSIPCPAANCPEFIDIPSLCIRLDLSLASISRFFRIKEPELKPLNIPCLGCESVISLDSRGEVTSETRPVLLYCVPSEHAFCSKVCFQKHIESSTDLSQHNLQFATCPQCKVSIEPSLIFDSYDGEENFRTISHGIRPQRAVVESTRSLGLNMCMECRKNKGVWAPCGHLYCEECMKGWCELLLTRNWKKIMPCPMCGEKINVERFRKHSNTMTNILSVAKHKLFG